MELTAGVRKIRPVEASTAPEALAAGFTHRVRGAVGSGFAGGGLLDRLDPGPDLADFTAQAWSDGLARLSDDELIGVLCAWRRQGSGPRPGSRLPSASWRAGPAPGLNQDGHLDEEIAAALTLTGRAASRSPGWPLAWPGCPAQLQRCGRGGSTGRGRRAPPTRRVRWTMWQRWP